MNSYEKDLTARYLAMRIIQHEKNPNTGIEYNRAITAKTTTKEAVDWWIEQLKKTQENII